MKNNWIKNFNALALSPNRRTILEIINTGLGAIDTEKVMRDSILLEGDVLKIKNQSFYLTQFKKIKVSGALSELIPNLRRKIERRGREYMRWQKMRTKMIWSL